MDAVISVQIKDCHVTTKEFLPAQAQVDGWHSLAQHWDALRWLHMTTWTSIERLNIYQNEILHASRTSLLPSPVNRAGPTAPAREIHRLLSRAELLISRVHELGENWLGVKKSEGLEHLRHSENTWIKEGLGHCSQNGNMGVLPEIRLSPPRCHATSTNTNTRQILIFFGQNGHGNWKSQDATCPSAITVASLRTQWCTSLS